jgi:hypothetical protein
LPTKPTVSTSVLAIWVLPSRKRTVVLSRRASRTCWGAFKGPKASSLLRRLSRTKRGSGRGYCTPLRRKKVGL